MTVGDGATATKDNNAKLPPMLRFKRISCCRNIDYRVYGITEGSGHVEVVELVENFTWS